VNGVLCSNNVGASIQGTINMMVINKEMTIAASIPIPLLGRPRRISSAHITLTSHVADAIVPMGHVLGKWVSVRCFAFGMLP
jgi:hypothetical protein